MGEDERLLLDYSRRGETGSLSALVVRNARWMLAFLRGMLRSPHDAEDVLQEAWLRVIKARGAYRGGSCKAYLARIVRTAAVDFLRKSGRYVFFPDAEDGLPGDVECAEVSPDAAFEIKATSEDVLSAVASLALPEREVVLMRIEGELPFREIAEQLNLPIGTVLTRMRSATIKLRNKLKEAANG